MDEVYPGVIGYWAEFCGAFPRDGDAPSDPAASLQVGFQMRLHAPCWHTAPVARTVVSSRPGTCVVMDPEDPLAVRPASVAGVWGADTGVEFVEDEGHFIAADSPAVLAAVSVALRDVERGGSCGGT